MKTTFNKLTALLAVLFLALTGAISLVNAPTAKAAVTDVDLATLISNATDANDSGTDCSTGTAPCWTWTASTGTLEIANDSSAVVKLADATIATAVNIVVGANGSLTLPGTLTVDTAGTLKVNPSDTVLDVNGTLILKGKLVGAGKISGGGQLKVEGGDYSGFTGTLAVDVTPKNTKRGVCDAPGLTGTPNATTDNNLNANQAVSTGAPADAVFCDVNVNLDVLETISLKVDTADVAISAPVAGSPKFNFEESASPLEAVVDTNSADGYQLLIKGVTTNATNTNCSVVTLLCIIGAGTATIPTGNFKAPASNQADAKWGYRALVGSVADSLDGTCTGRVVKDSSSAIVTAPLPTTKTTCEDGSNLTTAESTAGASTVDTAGTWIPNSGNGTNADASVATASCSDGTSSDEATCKTVPGAVWNVPFAAAVAGTTQFLKIPEADQLVKTGTTNNADSNVVCDTAPSTLDDATTCAKKAAYGHPVTSAKTFFKFGVQISTATPAGKYKGTVRLTAVPSL